MDKKIILVTGGGGYIGTHTVDQLLKKGYQVRIFDQFIFGKEPLLDIETNSNVQIIKGNIEEDKQKLEKAVEGVYAVIHLAGLVGDPACSLDEGFTIKMNIIATRIVKELSEYYKIPRFIFASSASVYGASDKVMNEESDTNPMSLYAQTKVDSEKEIIADKSEDFHPTVLRFGTVFGHSKRPRFDLVGNMFIAQAFTDGKITVTGNKQWRPFVHVADIASAIILTLEAPISKIDGQIFNVGDDTQNTTIGNLAKLAADVVKKDKNGNKVEVLINDDLTDKRNYRVTFEKIRNVLNFKASVPLEKGLKEVYLNLTRGVYKGSYKDPIYSNVATTKLLLK